MNLKESVDYVCNKFEDVDRDEIRERVEEFLQIDEDILEADLDLISPEGIITNMLVTFLPVRKELRS